MRREWRYPLWADWLDAISRMRAFVDPLAGTLGSYLRHFHGGSLIVNGAPVASPMRIGVLARGPRLLRHVDGVVTLCAHSER